MPRVAELKMEDGQVWARIDADMLNTSNPIHLLSGAEIDMIKQVERNRMRHALNLMDVDDLQTGDGYPV